MSDTVLTFEELLTILVTMASLASIIIAVVGRTEDKP